MIQFRSPLVVPWATAAVLALAVTVSGLAERLPVRAYTTADGLPRDQPYYICRDSIGYLWFATAEGLSRFDGYRFTTYGIAQGLPRQAVLQFLQTSSGEYWAVTAEAVCRFDPSAAAMSRFQAYAPPQNGRPPRMGPICEEAHGSLWCGTDDGLYLLSRAGHGWRLGPAVPGLPRRTQDSVGINCLLSDRLGYLWIGMNTGLYRRGPGSEITRFSTDNGLPADGISALVQDHTGRLWVGTESNGLCRLALGPDPRGRIVELVLTERDGLFGDRVQSLFETSNRSLWVGSFDGMTEIRLDGGGGQPEVRAYGRAHGLPGGWLMPLAEDGAGNLWVGTELDGALRITRGGFVSYGEPDGLQVPGASSIFEDQAGNLCRYINKERPSIAVFDGRRFQVVPINLPRQVASMGWGSHQLTMQDRDGEWWVPTADGLCRYPRARSARDLVHLQASAVYTTKDGLSGNEIFRLFEDSRGDIWIGTITGGQRTLNRWVRATGRFQQWPEILPKSAPTAFCEDRDGAVWIGYYADGVVRYRGGRFELFGEPAGVPPGFIFTIYRDRQGRIWIGSTRGGVARVDDPAAAVPHFRRYSTHEGLSSDWIASITEDNFGRIYFGTGRGVDRLDPATGNVQHYTTSDGLAGSQVMLAYRDRRGDLWFGMPHGLSRLVPVPDRPDRPPSILITRLLVAGTPYPISDLGETHIGPLDLAPEHNNLQIEFVGLGDELGEELRYQYKLEGADIDWSTPGSDRVVNYARLSPGRYRFLVRSTTPLGTTSQATADVEFIVEPPFWLRWWFFSAAAGLAASIAYAAHRLRLARVLELERIRMRIATDLHDDVGSSLSQIAVLGEVARETAGRDPVRSDESLDRIGEISGQLIESVSDIVWAINPKRDHLRDLVQRMRRFASDLLTSSGIAFRFHAPAGGDSLRLGPDQRRHVFLIFKEGLHNVVRHSRCTRAEITLQVEGGWLALVIADDGRGFDMTAAREAGHGLASMPARAAAIGGTLQIVTEPSHGTRLFLRVPVMHKIRGPSGGT